jgi:predicted ribosomally synthesized peptide with SipW-like signal peptide
MNMIKKVTNFVLNKLQKKKHLLFRTNEEGSTIRKTRLRKFGTKSKKLIVATQLVAIWYLLILSGSYLTTDTGAYFNDVDKITGTISIAENFCEGAENGSDFWHKYCKDNAGIGNGPDTPDVDTGEGTDPDNPGHNNPGCDDHTNAPCSDLRIKESHTSNSISLSWSNPNKDFDYVNIFRDDSKTQIGEKIKNGKFEDKNLSASKKYIYHIVVVDKSGKETTGTTIEITTSDPENVIQQPIAIQTTEDETIDDK